MPLTPTEGKVAKVTVGATDVPGVNWSNPIRGNPKDVSNFRDGRRIKTTLPNATITMSLVWDADDQPTDVAASNIRIGTEVTVKCYTDATHFFSGPYTVTEIGPKNDGVEDVVMMDVTFGLNGDITYPVAPV